MVKPKRDGKSGGKSRKGGKLKGKKGVRKDGNAARYMTRSEVLTHLQLKLPEFRRLCILKGIHPREPKKKFAGHNKTYYHVKDVKFLAHEPLLEKSREIKAFEKKIKKARAKKNEEGAQRLDKLRPTYRLDHLLKERYPSFVDALRDMDDAVTMMHLFSTLPADSTLKIPAERVHAARRLILEWQAFITQTHALRKVFVSVKGIYYQATVSGQEITWLCPHVVSQILPNDVDYRVMLTFVEFYETLVGFVNFKLYHSLGLAYPPIVSPSSEQAAGSLEELIEIVVTAGNDVGQDDAETVQCRDLFKGLKFFLAREVPRESLLFVIRCFGGAVSWDGEGSPLEETDESITHQIVDRPNIGHQSVTREYVQPQWVYDSLNARVLLPVDAYLYGKIPPPHLSPFVDNEAEGYIPDQALPVTGKKSAKIAEIENGINLAVKDVDLQQEPVERVYAEQLQKEMEGVCYSSSLNDQGQKQGLQSEQPKVVDDDHTGIEMMMPRKQRKLYEAIQMGKAKKKASVELLQKRKKKIEDAKSLK
ncbi:unnamed protein product [Calypogeia fissa]